MASALEQLLSRHDANDRFDTPTAELLPLHVEAANEKFQTQVDQIPLLKNRASQAGINEIKNLSDLVPLLFAHNTYKSYGEPWLIERQWERMARWLGTVTTYQPGDASFDLVDGIDAWIEALEQHGRYVTSTSGTTGKPALLGAVWSDIEFSAQGNAQALTWATGIQPLNDRKFFGIGPRTTATRNEQIRLALVDAFADGPDATYQLPLPPISTGDMMEMILLRATITGGTALPTEVARFEQLVDERTSGMEEAVADAVQAIVKSRDQKMMVAAMWSSLYDVAKGVREQGFSGADFQPDAALMVGGGLKGAQLPPDYKEFIFETFNFADERMFHLYSMQEINTPFPRGPQGEYHIAPWVIPLPLDQPGERLLERAGAVEGRAAFLDLSLDGRWGGVIAGDKVTFHFDRPGSPTVADNVARYVDLEGDDKISCAGTIDAYVRGAT